MRQAALGFRVHSGWTSLVAIAFENNAPIVLTRQRPHLVGTFSYTFRQPYHTAEKMPIDDARTFVERIREESLGLAVEAIRAAQNDVKQQGYEAKHCALLLASGRELPALEKILASHAMIHTADGELFREAVVRASARCKMNVTRVRERELLVKAADVLNMRAAILMQRVSGLGRSIGPPWSQDEKLATVGACIALRS